MSDIFNFKLLILMAKSLQMDVSKIIFVIRVR